MSYNSLSEMQGDAWLKRRLIACASEQKKGDGNPEAWVDANIWNIVNAPGWGAKWEQAKNNSHPAPGIDESVIADGDILAVIQPMP